MRSLLVTLSLVTAAWCVEPRQEAYVVNTKPASVTVVDIAHWKKIGSIPLDPEPTYAVISADNRFLYVLHKGLYRLDGMLREAESELAVIDLEKRASVRKIGLAWGTTSIALSGDGRYLLAVSQGKTGKKRTREEFGSVTIVDTRNNEVAVTLSAGRLGLTVAVTRDLSRIAVLSRGEPPRNNGKPYVKPVVTLFSIDQERPLAEIEFDRAGDLQISQDQKWLYVLDPGFASKKASENKDGMVHVIDLAATKLVAGYNVGSMPHSMHVDAVSGALHVLAQKGVKDRAGLIWRFDGSGTPQRTEAGTDLLFLRRLGAEPGLFAIGSADMRFVPDRGAVTTTVLPLKSTKSSPQVKGLGGLPGEVLYLPGARKVVLTVRTPTGAPTSKVAIISLVESKVENVITTGRGSVKFGKLAAAAALSGALSGLSYYSGYSMAQATGSPFFFYNIYSFTPALPNIELSSSPDERFVYALNTLSNDVTVIDTASGAVIDKIAVGGGCRRVALAPGSRFIYTYTGSQVNLIDAQANKKHLEHHVENGRIRSLRVMEEQKQLVALASKSLVVIDADKGAVVHTIDGFDEPYILVQPGRSE